MRLNLFASLVKMSRLSLCRFKHAPRETSAPKTKSIRADVSMQYQRVMTGRLTAQTPGHSK